MWDSGSATESVECRHWAVRWELSIADGQNFHPAEHRFPSAANSNPYIAVSARANMCDAAWQGCAITLLLEAAGCLWGSFPAQKSRCPDHSLKGDCKKL